MIDPAAVESAVGFLLTCLLALAVATMGFAFAAIAVLAWATVLEQLRLMRRKGGRE